MSVTEIGDFLVLPVQLPGSTSTHYIYFKKHTPKKASPHQNSALFFYNLPIATTTKLFKKYLQTVAIGATLESYTPSVLTDSIETVWLDLTKLTSDLELLNTPSFEESAAAVAALLPKHCAVASFVDKSALQLAFSALKKLSVAAAVSQWPQDEPLGPQWLLRKHQSLVLDKETLLTQVSQAMVDFDEAEQKLAQELQNLALMVDEDGFTLVVGSHRKTKAAILGKQKLAATVGLEKARSKEKSKEKEDFYRFQLRQKKKDEMNDLLRKFKEDQERVRVMKEKKRFRPY